ncbi:MAG: chemotaxis protein CheB [Pseudomonadota bacterium]
MHKIILIGTSAGGLHALAKITSVLPANLAATVLIVMHIGAHASVLPKILQKQCSLPVAHAQDGEPLLLGRILIAPPDLHLTVEKYQGQPIARLWHGPKENHTRPAIDPLFRSAAAAFDGHVIATILTGYLDDGTAGLHAVKTCGGHAVVQDPSDAQVPDMPASAIAHVMVDQVLPLHEIGPALVAWVDCAELSAGETGSARLQPMVPEWLLVENSYVKGEAGLRDLQKIGSPSGYTCPECNGSLWKITDAVPARYRCHTGHSFSARVLSKLQDEAVEMALWSSLRALQEKLRMEEEFVQSSSAQVDLEAQQSHRQRAAKLHADINTLHALLAKSD